MPPILSDFSYFTPDIPAASVNAKVSQYRKVIRGKLTWVKTKSSVNRVFGSSESPAFVHSDCVEESNLNLTQRFGLV